MGILPDDFYLMSWREFFLLIKGRRKREEDEFLRQSMLTREVAYQIYQSIPLKKGKSHVAKKRYWEHPWDKYIEDQKIGSMREAMNALKNKNGTGD